MYPDDLLRNARSILYINMFDAQARLARDYIMGNYEIPAKKERNRDIIKWLNLDAKSTTGDDEVDLQSAYIKDLISKTNYPEFNIDDVAVMFKQWLKDKEDNILGYRDQRFRSVITGTKAAEHHTAWLDEMDHSFERFINEDGVEVVKPKLKSKKVEKEKATLN